MSVSRNTPVDDGGEAAGARSADESRSRAVEALLPRFIGRRERDVGAILEALERRDFRSIETLGHNLRGNGISYGFPEISTIGEALEEAAKARRADRVLGQLTALKRWIEVTREGNRIASNDGSTKKDALEARPEADPVSADDKSGGTGKPR